MNQEILNFSQTHAEPEWLADRRQAAFLKYEELSLPRIERVKFDRWGLDQVSLAVSPENATVPDFAELPNHPLVVQVGSHTVLEQLSPDLLAQGVRFTDFYRALEELPDLIQQHLYTAVNFDEDRLTAANAAFFSSGLVLYVPDNVTIEQPLEAIFQTDATDFVKHILIIAGKHSKFSYLERLQTPQGASAEIKGSVIVEVIALEGAQVKFAAIDELGAQVSAFVSRRGRIAENASVDWALGVMNDGNIIADFDSDLKGAGSHSEIKAVGISTGKQVQGIDTRVTNYGINSIGHIQQSGVILDRGTLTFNGIGHIIKGAKGADAQQSSRVLMLSDKARGDANPILLIDENDVTAGHAASVGQVDPDDLYYLQSRGLDEETAKRLVIRGFLGAVVTEIPVKSVREEFIATIERKLAL